MEDNLIIREYTHADAKGVAGLYNKCSFYHAEYGYQISESDIISSYKERGTYVLIVALSGSNLIGVLGCFPVSGQKVAGKNEAFIGSLLVHPEYRGGGTLIKSLYAKMIQKVVERQLKCICTEIFPSNDLSLRLAKRTGYVYTQACKNDMDDYIDLKSYLPATLQCFYAKDIQADKNEVVDVYNLGFTLLYSREQQRMSYITSEVEEVNREIVLYPIKIENAKYNIKVDVISESVCSLESEYFKISCHLEKGNEYYVGESFNYDLEIVNKYAGTINIQLKSSEKGSQALSLGEKFILTEKESKICSKKIQRRRIGLHCIVTQMHIRVGEEKDFYLNLGIGFQIKKPVYLELKSINLPERKIYFYCNENRRETPNIRQGSLNWNDSNIITLLQNKNITVEQNNYFTLIKFMEQLLVFTDFLQIRISLDDGRLELFSKNAELIMTELWPDICYPHISGLKIDTKKDITYYVDDNQIVLKQTKGTRELIRVLTVKGNKIKFTGNIKNNGSRTLKESMGKIQPWLEWIDAQAIVPSSGKIFQEELIYNVFPLGISDMIVGNINEFTMDMDVNKKGWTAFTNGTDYLKFSWDSCSDVRFGQRWMPCLMFQTPEIDAYGRIQIPSYEYCLYENDSFLSQEESNIYDYVYMEESNAWFQSTDTGDLELCFWALFKTYSNFNLNCRIHIDIVDIQNQNIYSNEYDYAKFNSKDKIELRDSLKVDLSNAFQMFRIKLTYEDRIRIREFSIPALFCRKEMSEVTSFAGKRAEYLKYQIEDTEASFDVTPEYGQSISSIQYKKSNRLHSSYPKCIPYEAEEQWFGGISNYCIMSARDKLTSMLKPDERLTDIMYGAFRNEYKGYQSTGVEMVGMLKGHNVKNTLSFSKLNGSSIMLMLSAYECESNDFSEFTSVFSIYPKVSVQHSDKCNFYFHQYGSNKNRLQGYKKINAVAVSEGKKYIIFEDREEVFYFVAASCNEKNQFLYLNHLKSGVNICVTQDVKPDDEETKEFAILTGCFSTKEEAEFFGENAEAFYKQLKETLEKRVKL